MKKILISLLVISLFYVTQATAQTQPANDPIALISHQPRPNVMLLIDTSGSMLWDTMLDAGNEITVRKEPDLHYVYGFPPTYSYGSDNHKVYLVDSDNSRSRLGQAKQAIKEISSQMTEVNFGIGRFKKTLVLNRFRASVPTLYNQLNELSPSYTDFWIDGQLPSIGQMNIQSYRRHDASGGGLVYPYARVLKRYNEYVGSISKLWTVWDPLDVVWTGDTSPTISVAGQLYVRLNWNATEIEDARYMMFRALDSNGNQIYRGDYMAPDALHRNKLNQIDNIDMFLSDSEFIMLKANTPLGATLTVEKYVENAYGNPMQRTLRFTYNPTVADWDGTTNCGDGEIIVGIQDRANDDPSTPIDESSNKDEIIATAGPINSNAKIYDFTVDPAQLTDLGAFFGMGGTPLGQTLDAARNYYQTVVIPRDTQRGVNSCRANYVVLLTDGFDTCGGNPDTIAADLYSTYGIKVYVIGFVTDPSVSSILDGIAAAGGTGTAFRASNKQDLIDIFSNISLDIKTTVELSSPVAVSSSTAQNEISEGDVVLLPFFEFPTFDGRLQARKLFRNALVEIDPKTGDIVTDATGNPTIIEDNLTDARIDALVNDPTNPIGKDPTREIIGVRYDPPIFLWESGELLSQPYIDDPAATMVYPYLKPDTTDLDGDGNTVENIVNPAYRTSDERRVLTTLSLTNGSMPVINFDTATMIDNGTNQATAKSLLGASTWSNNEAKFLINYTRGKTIQRFSETTNLYGQTYNPGDPIPDGPDNNGDGIPDGFLYKERDWKTGDIVGSTPILIKAPTGTYPLFQFDSNNTQEDFKTFVTNSAGIPQTVVIGGNDGMLHAYTLNGIDVNADGDFDDLNEYYPGEEVWAFVPPDLMGKLKDLYNDSALDGDFAPDGQQVNPHTYFVDAQLTVAIVYARIHSGDTDGDGSSTDPEFRQVLIFGEGRGGNRYWCLDVTDPMNPKPVWSLTDSTMGMTISRPAVGPVQVASAQPGETALKYFAFMGSGYDYSQVDGSATVGNVFYRVDIQTGAIVDSFSAGDAAGGAGIPNAIISRGILVDDDNDFLIERAYCADLDGNIWRWNLDSLTVTNLLNTGSNPITTQAERLDRPIVDSITYANIFGFNIITAVTGGDTRRYLDSNNVRTNFPRQVVYLILDTDQAGQVVSLMDGEFDDTGAYQDTGTTPGVDLPQYMIGENQPVASAFTEYDDTGKIYRGFQFFYPTYTPDSAGLSRFRCTFGNSDLLMLESIFSESNIVESPSSQFIDMGEGKATGVTYTGGNILFSVGDQFKVYGSGVFRFESAVKVEAKLKVLEWREVY